MRCHQLALGMLAVMLCAAGMTAHAGEYDHDIPGSQDSPLITRYPGSVIIGYTQSDFDKLSMPAGPFDDTAGSFSKSIDAAGRVTQIAYAAPPGKSAFAVFHNYQQALRKAGFSTLYDCADKACGSAYAVGSTLVTLPLIKTLVARADGSQHNEMIDTLMCRDNLHLLTAKLKRDDATFHVSLMVCGNPGQRAGVLQRVVRQQAMQTDLISVDASAIRKGLEAKGHIALRGVHFATDSATLSTKSDKTLDEMVKFLRSSPDLKVYIVGHTDSTGSLNHNLDLSEARAESVVKALVKRGIHAKRLRAEGVASFAPVASNASEAGRAKNRRVEMVKQ